MQDVGIVRTHVIAGLLAAAVLAVAFRCVPAMVAGDEYGAVGDMAAVTRAVGANLISYWKGGVGDLPPGLVDLVDYWRRWHVAKIVISALWTAVLAVLAAVSLRRFLRVGSGQWTAVADATAAAAATLLAVAGVVVLVANVQATVEPLPALLGLLPVDPADGELAQTLDQIRHGLADPGSSEAGRPALAVLIASHTRYLWTIVVAGSVVGVAMGGAGVVALRAFVSIDTTRSRPRFTALGVSIASAVVAAALFALVVTSVRSAVHPTSALLDFFTDG